VRYICAYGRFVIATTQLLQACHLVCFMSYLVIACREFTEQNEDHT